MSHGVSFFIPFFFYHHVLRDRKIDTCQTQNYDISPKMLAGTVLLLFGGAPGGIYTGTVGIHSPSNYSNVMMVLTSH